MLFMLFIISYLSVFYLRDAEMHLHDGGQGGNTFRALINATRASKLARAQYGLLSWLLCSYMRDLHVYV